MASSKDAQLSAELAEQKQVNASYGQQVGDLSTTVGDLSKLASIDPQLLAKYSKIYFLNENYVPAKLSNIDPKYVYGTNTLQNENFYDVDQRTINVYLIALFDPIVSTSIPSSTTPSQ